MPFGRGLIGPRSTRGLVPSRPLERVKGGSVGFEVIHVRQDVDDIGANLENVTQRPAVLTSDMIVATVTAIIRFF